MTCNLQCCKVKWPFVSIFLFLLFISCNKDNGINTYDNNLYHGTDIISFKLFDDNNEYVPFIINDSIIHLTLPSKVCNAELSISLEHNGFYAEVDGKPYNPYVKYDFSDFCKPHKIRITSYDGMSNERTIQIYDLPVLVIDTPGESPILSKTEKVEGTAISLIDSLGRVEIVGTAGIEGRGHSTWKFPKKPYNFKLEKKYGILGMKKGKHWILLANTPHMDRSQIHNAVAFEMARLTDYPWVQSGRYVELILNGTHKGLYYLCEKIRVQDERVNIEIMEPSDTIEEKMTGGYFLESAFIPGEHIFQTEYFNKTSSENPLYWEIKKPEETLQPSQMKYIVDDMNHLEKLLLNEDSVKEGRYRNYLDIETAINWMLVEEATVNQESLNPSNLFLYKDKGGKLSFGPPWDFDAHTFGVYGENKVFLNRPSFYFYWMLKDPFFVKRLKEKWLVYKQIWQKEIPLYIDNLYEQIHRSSCRNELMWPPDWSNPIYSEEKSYMEVVDDMKVFFISQINYLDEIIMNY